ncbi:MAG: hypothetical protein O3B13_01005 [Planctomycetota bacterium]|nr:hypothetical protein [Planctomycetota bacterium]
MFEFRRRVWIVKLVEACCGAVFGVLLAFLMTFLLDRLWDTPASVRIGLFATAVLACTIVPLALHRWVWRQRKIEQLAILLTRTYPSIGDQLLGIIELVRSESEQARSMALCEAAIQQVAEQAAPRDFTTAVPEPRHVRRAVLAGLSLAGGLALLTLYPAATANAWSRFLMPWRDTSRYTFTMVESQPEQLFVAHGEPFDFAVKLASQSVSRPESGMVQSGVQRPVESRLNGNQYVFNLPPQIDSSWLNIEIGDFTQRIRIEPVLRPELSSFVADVELPAYLERATGLHKDVRGGVVSLVQGSRATFTATASRKLQTAIVGGKSVSPRDATIVSPSQEVNTDSKVDFEWTDEFGLASKEPFTLTIKALEDEVPAISCADLPRQKVLLDTEQLAFTVHAQDDFGVRRVGMVWQGLDKTNFATPAQGERIISAGGPDKELLELAGTFSASSLGIEPQPIEVRLFAEDFFPGRERVYSPPHLLYVLNAEQHAIWLTEQLSKWHRQSLDVRDRELQLYETNKQLRELTADEITQPDNRRKIESQAAAERANGRRLSGLSDSGQELIQQAMRNPEFGVGHLEKWAEMLQILKDISSNRMPSVADMLKQASEAPKMAQSTPNSKAPSVGQVRNSASGDSPPGEDDGGKKPQVPGVVDVESSHQPLDKKDGAADKPGDSKGAPRLGLAGTTLIGGGPKGGDSCPVNDKMEEAVEEQRDLLAEFEKIADELNQLLANLEGSTLVKRLKAASRVQYKIAGRIGDEVTTSFGVPAKLTPTDQKKLFSELSGLEETSTLDVSNIMDDMQAYFERRRFMQFKTVLDEMRNEDVLGALRQLGDDLPKESGLSIAQCEFWSDTFDRWAEDLVEPASGGT